MYRYFFFGFFLFLVQYKGQVAITGIVTDESGIELPAVFVINITTDEKTYTDALGRFTINASVGNELRFLKTKYDRGSIKISEQNTNSLLSIYLYRTPVEIEEVEIKRLTGDLKKDSKILTKRNRVEELQNEIGVPRPPEKPREKPAEVGKDVLLPLIGIPPRVNVQAIYDVVSGKARRQKSLYRFEDFQDKIIWLRKTIPDEFYTEQGLSKEKIGEFLQFAILVNPEISKAALSKNASLSELLLIDLIPKYLEKQNAK